MRSKSFVNLYGGWTCVVGGLVIAVVICVVIGAMVMLAGLAGLDAAGVI